MRGRVILWCLCALAQLPPAVHGILSWTTTTVAGVPRDPAATVFLAVDGVGTLATFTLPRVLTPLPLAPDSFYLTDGNTIRNLTFGSSDSPTVQTLVGNRTAGRVDGPGHVARLSASRGLAVNPATDQLYIGDSNGLVRVMSPSLIVTTLAGNGSGRGIDGVGTQSSFGSVYGLALLDEFLVVADYNGACIRKVSLSGVVGTLAGVCSVNNKGSIDGKGTSAVFWTPAGLAADRARSLVYLVDFNTHNIRTITSDGAVTTIAGTGAKGQTDGPAALATFQNPVSVALAADGTVFCTDYYGNSVRKLSPSGFVTTIAGGAGGGYQDGVGQQALFNLPYGITVRGSGGALLMTDSGFIRQLTLESRAVPLCSVDTYVGSGAAATLPGTGTAAAFFNPYAVALDMQGQAYVSDSGYILKVSPLAVVSIVAGNGTATWLDGRGTSAALSARGLAVNALGLLYFSDASHRLRALSPDGYVTTLAGNGSAMLVDGAGTAACFSSPLGLALDMASNVIYLVDNGNSAIRAVNMSAGLALVRTLAGRLLKGFQNGLGTAATFNNPNAIALTKAGALVVSEESNNAIRLMLPPATEDGAWNVSTLAGFPTGINTVDGPGSLAQIPQPRGVAVDGATGNIFVAQYGAASQSYLRMIAPNGVVSTLAGRTPAGLRDGAGTAATLSGPQHIATDVDGDAMFIDQGNRRLRRLRCRACPLGSFCPTNTSQIPCPGGTIGTVSGNNSATACAAQCPPGFYCPPGTSPSTVAACPPGSFCGAAAAAPRPCAPGSFAGVPSRQSCILCSPGTLAPLPGAAVCDSFCPSGKFRASPGGVNESSCSSCPAGYYGPSDGLTACVACSAGSYSTALGAVEESVCQSCPPGRASPPGTGDASGCAAVLFSCPLGMQPALGLAARPATLADCAPLTCAPPLALALDGSACTGCAAGTAGAFPACAACGNGGICPGATRLALDPGALQLGPTGSPGGNSTSLSAAAAAAAPPPPPAGALPAEFIAFFTNIYIFGVSLGVLLLGLLLLGLLICCRHRFPVVHYLDSFALKSPEKEGASPVLEPTEVGGLCTILGACVILAMATLQVLTFSTANTSRSDAIMPSSQVALEEAAGLAWADAAGVTLTVQVAALGEAGACAAPLKWLSSSFEGGGWQLQGGSSSSSSSSSAAAWQSFSFTCQRCSFQPDSFLTLYLHHSCQALALAASATAGDGSPARVVLPYNSTSAAPEGRLQGVAWTLSPLLNVLQDAVHGTSAKGYYVLSSAYSAQRAQLQPAPAPAQLVSIASTGSAVAAAPAPAPQAVLLTPLAAAVQVQLSLPLNPLLATTRLQPMKTVLDLFSDIAGLMGLLGAFGVGAAAVEFLQSKVLGGSGSVGGKAGALTRAPAQATAAAGAAASEGRPPATTERIADAAFHLDVLPPGWTHREDRDAGGEVVFLNPAGVVSSDPRNDFAAFLAAVRQAEKERVDLAQWLRRQEALAQGK